MEIGRPQAEMTPLNFGIRWEEVNLANIEKQIFFDILRGENTSLGRENLRPNAEIERLTLSPQETEMESARIQSPWEDVLELFSVEEMYPTGVGSGTISNLSVFACYQFRQESQTSWFATVVKKGAM